MTAPSVPPSTSESNENRGPAPARAGGQPRGGRGAVLVAAGILLSRIMGLVRERVFAHYLGNSEAAAAWRVATRIPNFLQNLLGEGVLSASFIPVYAQLLGKDDKAEADRVAGAVFGLLSVLSAVLVALGVWATPLLVDLVAPGLEGETRTLTLRLVRILFPGTGLLVLSAWCLGILNSHRRFFLSYAAPVLWNVALIATLVGLGGFRTQDGLVVALAWGAVLGSALQLGVQVPGVLAALGRLRPSLDVARASVRRVVRSFGPVLVGRGVVQVSAYIDTVIVSYISTRAISGMGYAQILYLLPVSLFGMAVSAAELPDMARAAGEAKGTEALAAKLRARIDAGTQRIAFFVVPSMAAFLFLGDVVSGALLQTGSFNAAEARYLWYLLVGSTAGLLATTFGRLYASGFYALHDTRRPLYFALARVTITALASAVLGLWAPGWLGLPRDLGGAFVLAATGFAAWVEFLLLKRGLTRRVGRTGLPRGYLPRLWVSAAVAALVALGIKVLLARAFGPDARVLEEWGGSLLPAPSMHPVLVALAVLGPFGVLYFGVAHLLGVGEASAVVRRVLRRR